MQNTNSNLGLDHYVRPFSVLVIKILFEAAYFSLAYFVLDKAAQNTAVFIAATIAFALMRIGIFLPLYFGTVRFFCCRVFFGISCIKNMFSFFSPKLFFKAIKNGLLFILFRFLCFAVFFLPVLSMLGLIWYNLMRSVSVSFVFLSLAASVLLLIFGIRAFSRAMKLVFLFSYLFVLSPEKKTAEHFGKSIDMMKGKTISVTVLKFGNFFRVLLCAAIVPIGFVWNSCQQRKALLAKNILIGQTEQAETSR